MAVKKLPFLLEIGSEEIPDWMIEPALEQLKSLFEDLLAQNKLGGKVASVDATPRRLVHAGLQVTEQGWQPMHWSRFITMASCAMTRISTAPPGRGGGSW